MRLRRGKHLKDCRSRPHVGKHLDDDIHQRAQRTEEEDDVNPKHVRPSADEVDNGEYLEQ